MALTSISPQAARQLLEQGAVLVDIRAADEYAREHIAGARHMPVEQLASAQQPLAGASAVIYHCRGGQRTRMNAVQLAGCVSCEAYMLEGGLDAWKQAGLQVETDRSQPLELQRQVQIGAGSLVLLGVVLGYTVSPWLFLLSGFVGAGLVFAGVSGFCGMARLLQKMPWNRRAGAA
ncbi:rhodanese family protein [Halopseudomonas xiamenensis]|uniref:rhodanese family protein n=1 Tax=Halopseudomonas xiamenensis TaxID=157792 RepID=UPI001623A3A3|nr:rhodanese family protein [Halopseudomonas xiamenensis]